MCRRRHRGGVSARTVMTTVVAYRQRQSPAGVHSLEVDDMNRKLVVFDPAHLAGVGVGVPAAGPPHPALSVVAALHLFDPPVAVLPHLDLVGIVDGSSGSSTAAVHRFA